MSYSIRHSIVNGRGYLHAAIGDARETLSGFWIISINNQAQDVAKTRDDAIAMLKAAIDKRGSGSAAKLCLINRYLSN